MKDLTPKSADTHGGTASGPLLAFGTVAASAAGMLVAARSDRRIADLLAEIRSLQATEERLRDELTDLRELRDVYETFRNSTEETRDHVLASMCSTLNFEELRPFGGMDVRYGMSYSDSAGVHYFYGPAFSIGLIAALFDQYIISYKRDQRLHEQAMLRTRFDEAVLPLVRAAHFGARVFADKQKWPTLRAAKFDIPLIVREWDVINGVHDCDIVASENESGARGVSDLGRFCDGLDPRLFNLRFERLAMLAERSRPVFGTFGSYQWLYASPTWWAFLDAIRRAKHVELGKPANECTLKECLEKMTPAQIFDCMPDMMLQIASAIRAGRPQRFIYGTINTTIPAAAFGLAWRDQDWVQTSGTNEGTAVALRQLLASQYSITFNS